MKVAIFGSSGMARSVVDICDTMGCGEVVFINRCAGVEPVTGISILPESDVRDLAASGFGFVIGIGDNSIRQRIANTFSFLPFVNVVHSSATFGRGTRESLEEHAGNIVMAGARLSGNIRCGNFGLYNFNCVLGHDVRVGDCVHFGPGSLVCGNVDVGDMTVIWTGAKVRNGAGEEARISIGSGAALGIGSTVLSDVPPGALVPPNRVYASSRGAKAEPEKTGER